MARNPSIRTAGSSARSPPVESLDRFRGSKHVLSGLWSRQLSQKDRVVYRFDADGLFIFAIGGHYGDHGRVQSGNTSGWTVPGRHRQSVSTFCTKP
ncbi:MAG: type II toxin-antitoxin system YoeB family toxin [Lamprocystis purpurea]|nr:type II toxin-antitoxin system YoeB family toxin [Lamprocystis purpurea]